MALGKGLAQSKHLMNGVMLPTLHSIDGCTVQTAAFMTDELWHKEVKQLAPHHALSDRI